VKGRRKRLISYPSFFLLCYNLKRESFGLIVSFNDFGGGLLAEVKNFDKTFYLPMGNKFLEKINYEKKEVILNLDINFIKG